MIVNTIILSVMRIAILLLVVGIFSSHFMFYLLSENRAIHNAVELVKTSSIILSIMVGEELIRDIQSGTVDKGALDFKLDKVRIASGIRYIYVFEVLDKGPGFTSVRYISDPDFLIEDPEIIYETWSLNVFDKAIEADPGVFLIPSIYYEEEYGYLVSSFVNLYDEVYLGVDIDTKNIKETSRLMVISLTLIASLFILMNSLSLYLISSFIIKKKIRKYLQ